ncbi:MAG: SDR family oxidoreductase [Myxococcota bacterium]
MNAFEGKVVAITGAASGIGRALAYALADRGADLALSDWNGDGLDETRREVESRGRKVNAWRLDVSNREEVFQWAEASIADHGKVDAIINNAGVTVADTFAETSYEDLAWIMGVNFWGVVHGMKAFLPHFLERDSGHLVTISSVFGIIGYPGQSAYNATKFAVRGMTEALRQELADTNVKTLVVHPGGIKTNIVRNARFHRDAEGSEDRDKSVRQFDRVAKTTPEKAAEVILGAMERNDPRVLIGLDAEIIDKTQRLFPTEYPSAIARVVKVFDR